MALLVLFGGPAGAGKSTLARAWCATRARAAHVALDRVREMIVGGLGDPQQPNELQSRQYQLSVRACAALARVFLDAGYDVALDEVFPPDAFARLWRPLLGDLEWRLVVILPSLEETLRRSRGREKRVLERHTRDQHAASLLWPEELRIDTGGLTVEESLAEVHLRLDG